jgi:rhodanese-related sulfurtransferase
MRRVSPAEARDLIEKDGYTYVDVRSVPEFQAGHPTGAYNVPLFHMGPSGMTPNADFLSVMEQHFPKDAKLVVGCKSGGRSLRAATVLESAGYGQVVDQRAGFDGAMDALGRVVEPGWHPAGMPSATEAAADHSWDRLKQR